MGMKASTFAEAVVVAVLVALAGGCATAQTQAQLEQDPRDSLTAQRDYPKMYARQATTVGDMRRDWRLCSAASPKMQKYAAIHTPGADGWLAEGARDWATGGTHSSALLRDGVAETRVCMTGKGYQRKEE